MEEDVIYDLETAEAHAESAEERGAQRDESSADAQVELAPEGAETDCACGAAVGTTVLQEEETTEAPEKSEAEARLGKMVEEMGAETVLEIIRDNRNAAIRQILREVEATQRRDLPSGNSAARSCSSIFDLAALA